MEDRTWQQAHEMLSDNKEDLVVGAWGALLLEGTLDWEGDMGVYDNAEQKLVDTITRENAQAIVNHLTAVFGLGEK